MYLEELQRRNFARALHGLFSQSRSIIATKYALSKRRLLLKVGGEEGGREGGKGRDTISMQDDNPAGISAQDNQSSGISVQDNNSAGLAICMGRIITLQE